MNSDLQIKHKLIDCFKAKFLSESDFNDLAISIFNFQYKHNAIYSNYVNSLNINTQLISHYSQIPFLPIDFFKSKTVVCFDSKEQSTVFSSSGTTGSITSKHHVKDIDLYEQSYLNGFELCYGSISDYCILALLPNYLERNGSSLVYMFNDLINKSKHPKSNFYLNNINELKQTIADLKTEKQKTVLLGVTYALLDLADDGLELSDDFIVMETGGMKGKRKEMIKHELHDFLKLKFKINAIHSEYGMTELLSQAYSQKNGIYKCVPWMKVLIRELNDPFCYAKQNKTGGINVIDLANLYSCSFIETKDLGRAHEENFFEIMGRFDNSDLRGCNLMIQ